MSIFNNINFTEHKQKKTLGIGLLELLLAIIIITILFLSALRLYHVSLIAQKERTSFNAVAAVYTAGLHYVTSIDYFPTTGFGIQTFINNGLLPTNFTTSENPWGATLISANRITNTQISVTLPDLPIEVCNELKSRVLQLEFVSSGSDCGASSPTNLTITFKDYQTKS